MFRVLGLIGPLIGLGIATAGAYYIGFKRGEDHYQAKAEHQVRIHEERLATLRVDHQKTEDELNDKIEALERQLAEQAEEDPSADSPALDIDSVHRIDSIGTSED